MEDVNLTAIMRRDCIKSITREPFTRGGETFTIEYADGRVGRGNSVEEARKAAR